MRIPYLQARKLQPAIIFIDEIDSFLRLRASSDHETTAMMKAQFMTFWDGLVTDNTCEVRRITMPCTLGLVYNKVVG